jgi:hypothetical protein
MLAAVAHSGTLQSTARALCVTSELFHFTAQAIRADSLILKVRAQEVRCARRLHGASDRDDDTLTVLVVSVILERATCLICIASKVGATKLEGLRSLERMAATVHVAIEQAGRCRACGSTLGPVFSLDRTK